MHWDKAIGTAYAKWIIPLIGVYSLKNISFSLRVQYWTLSGISLILIVGKNLNKSLIVVFLQKLLELSYMDPLDPSSSSNKDVSLNKLFIIA